MSRIVEHIRRGRKIENSNKMGRHEITASKREKYETCNHYGYIPTTTKHEHTKPDDNRRCYGYIDKALMFT